MLLRRGEKSCFELLQRKSVGETVSGEELLRTTKWKDSSLQTYLKKNKLDPYLRPLGNDRYEVLQDGSTITKEDFHETFTQTAYKAA